MSGPVCGGFGNFKEAGAEEQAILDHVRGAVEERLNKVFNVFQAISYQTQVVAGVNYIFKVQIDDEVRHIKVAKPLPHTHQPPFLMEIDAQPM